MDIKKRLEPDSLYDRLTPSAAKRAKLCQEEKTGLLRCNSVEEVVYSTPTISIEDDLSPSKTLVQDIHLFDVIGFFNRHKMTFGKHYSVCDACGDLFFYTNAFQATDIYKERGSSFCSCCLDECNLCGDWYLADDMETHPCQCTICHTLFADGPDLDHPCHESVSLSSQE